MNFLTKQPDVTLVNFTPNPERTIAIAVQAWGADSLNKTIHGISQGEATELTRKALKAFHRTALEYVSMNFVIKNVSRAFQQQLTRTRQASYSIQSMRVVTKGKFAHEGKYTMPPALTENQQVSFHKKMLSIEKDYLELIEAGFPAEDARGILPLNIHSDISMTINLNSLYHMAGQRLCLNTQWEYRQVVLQMKKEIKNKMGSIFSDLLNAPCVGKNKCMVGEYCGIKVWAETPEKRYFYYKNYPFTEKYENQNDLFGGKL